MNQTLTYILICVFRWKIKIKNYCNVIRNMFAYCQDICCNGCKSICNKLCFYKKHTMKKESDDDDFNNNEKENNSYGSVDSYNKQLKNRTHKPLNIIKNTDTETNPLHLKTIIIEPQSIRIIRKSEEEIKAEIKEENNAGNKAEFKETSDENQNNKHNKVENLEDILSDDESDNTGSDSNESDDEKKRQKSYSDSVILKNNTKLKDNLLIISELKDGQKLWLDKDKLSIDTSYVGQSVIRKIYGQNRQNIIPFIKELMTDAETHTDEEINVVFNNAKQGLRYLKNVYSESDMENINKYVDDNKLNYDKV